MKIENEINRKENIYDIICYYNEGDNDDPQHVKEVINKIVKTSQQENLNTDKWIKWKLLGCLLINVLLNAPIYSYGTIYLLHKEAFDDDPKIVLPPIIFCSVYLLVTPWLFNTISTPSSRSSRAPKTDTSIFTKLTNKSVIIVFSLILCVSVSISGFTFVYWEANFVIILIFYSVIGGMSSCIIMGKLFVLINTILNNDRLHMINFIYSFGQALAQFAFPFMMKPLMGLVCHNCFFLMIGAVMFHIIPLTMLLMKSKFSLQLNQRKMTKSPIQLNLNDESRYSDTSDTFDFVVNIKYPSDVFDVENKWQNPNNNFKDISGSDPKCDHFLEDLEALRIMNSDGVEILQTIMETDEENENRNSELSDEIIESIYEEINRKHKQQRRQDISKPNECSFIKKFVFEKARRVSTTIYRQFVNPLHRSMKIFKFYPSVILKSCDIFSYILFITLILPNLALKQYRFVDREKVIYFITLMGLCWIIYALLVLKFHNRLKQNFIHYFHIIGLLGKFFGYLFTNQRYSINGFVFGLILISLGHANSFHLQEIMIRNCFHPRKWFYVRGSIYSFSGFLILIYCMIFHMLHVTLSFVTFCNIFVLFNLTGIIVWLLTHYKSIIYICSRY